MYISCALIGLVFVILIFFKFPESIKYLLAKGSFNEAKFELNKIYKMNKIPDEK